MYYFDNEVFAYSLCRAPARALESTDLPLKCTKYNGNFNLWKTVKTVANRRQILRLKCPRTRWRSLQRSPRPPRWILGAYFQGEGRGGQAGRERKGEGKAGEGRAGDRRGGRKGKGPRILWA
jgi:hypothetical protein